MIKLNVDDQEALRDLLDHPGIKPLKLAITSLVECQERAVLRYNLETGDEKALAFLKAQAEGAAKLLANLNLFLDQTRLASSSASQVRSSRRK